MRLLGFLHRQTKVVLVALYNDDVRPGVVEISAALVGWLAGAEEFSEEKDPHKQGADISPFLIFLFGSDASRNKRRPARGCPIRCHCTVPERYVLSFCNLAGGRTGTSGD